jgi:DNA-directed RNA polymerase specialized sigma24 family protein
MGWSRYYHSYWASIPWTSFFSRISAHRIIALRRRRNRTIRVWLQLYSTDHIIINYQFVDQKFLVSFLNLHHAPRPLYVEGESFSTNHP